MKVSFIHYWWSFCDFSTKFKGSNSRMWLYICSILVDKMFEAKDSFGVHSIVHLSSNGFLSFLFCTVLFCSLLSPFVHSLNCITYESLCPRLMSLLFHNTNYWRFRSAWYGGKKERSLSTGNSFWILILFVTYQHHRIMCVYEFHELSNWTCMSWDPLRPFLLMDSLYFSLQCLPWMNVSLHHWLSTW